MGFSLSDGLAEAGTICNFAAPPFGAIWGSNAEAAAVFLNAICGWDVSVDDVNEITLRNYYFNRCVSLREGYDPAEDGQLPPRAFEETITTKYGKDLILDQEEHLERLKQYYVEDLHLSEDGLPTRENVEKLGLDFVLSVLEPMGKIA
jgi:aldehyde:ferredoxin oxidoreductase